MNFIFIEMNGIKNSLSYANNPTLFRTEALTKLAEDIATLSSRVDSLDSGTDSSTSSSDIKTYTVSRAAGLRV